MSDSPSPCIPSLPSLLPAEFKGHLGFLLSRCKHRLVDRLDAVFEGEQLGIRHFVVTSLIERVEGLNQVQIGELLGYDRTTTMKIIDELQQRGIVERQRQRRDRRANAIAVTASGHQWWQQRLPAVMAEETAFMSMLSAGEQLLIKELLMRLAVGSEAKTTNEITGESSS